MESAMQRWCTALVWTAGTLAVVACAQPGKDRGRETNDQRSGATVLYQDRVIEVPRTLADPNNLWVALEDLPRINHFVLKPEGACLADLCVPVRQDRDGEMFVRRRGQ